jgi:HAD superfamily hydrolase (TIGR01509 family)
MEMFDGYVAGTPELMERLQARNVLLYALSNMTSETWPWHFKAFPKLAMFQDVIVSGDVGLVKPDPAIYLLTLERMGNPPPEDVIFIDDSLANIEAADALGFSTHHFTGSQSLEEALKQEGLL